MTLDDLTDISFPSIQLMNKVYADTEVDREETEVVYSRLSSRCKSITYYLNYNKDNISNEDKELLWQERECLNQYLTVLKKRLGKER